MEDYENTEDRLVFLLLLLELTNLFQSKLGHNFPGLLLAPALLALADPVLAHGGGPGALAPLGPGLLKLGDGVGVVTVRVGAGVILLLGPGLGVSHFCELRHLYRVSRNVSEMLGSLQNV